MRRTSDALGDEFVDDEFMRSNWGKMPRFAGASK
jgi:hypothetical protein